MKVIKTTATADQTTTEISLTTGLELPEKIKSRIKKDVGDYLVESILSSVGSAKSPVQGEDWPKLSKSYKKKKIDEGLPGVANMEMEGDMLDSLSFKSTEDGIELGFFGKEAPKADGHLKFSGKENGTPMRRFLPGEGDSFKGPIEKEVEKIIADGIAEFTSIKESDLNAVSSKADLYEVLGEYFQDMTRAEIKGAVTRSSELFDLLDSMGLIGFL